jgi:glycosyltransferase involved in cell wall biosynthesis
MGLTNDAIDVVVPVHNEGATIRSTLEKFYRAAAESHIRIRFVVAEDGSVDDTVAVLKLLAKELPLKLISGPIRKGCSRAVIDGIRATGAE